jgi:Zn-finger nucleic acid-binding protein
MRTTKEGNHKHTNELRVELKYCERCGGLWLRPGDGEQVYCAPCAWEMAQLPPPSRDPKTAGSSIEFRWDSDDVEFEAYEEAEGVDMDMGMDKERDTDTDASRETDMDAAGGVA